MKQTLLCALTIICYFLIVWGKRKLLSKFNKPIITALGVISEIVIFLGFIYIIAIIMEFDFTFSSINMTEFFEAEGSNIVFSIVVIIISSTILGIIKTLLFRNRKFKRIEGINIEQAKKRYTTMSKVIMSLSRYIIYIICVIVILGIWGVDVMPALAGLGIVGLVVGLGAQKLIGDFVSGIFIVFEHHFDVGDTIEVGDFKGTVIDIGLKTTKIKNWEGHVKIIANSELTNIINDSVFNTTFSINVSVSYDLNPKLVMEKLDEGLKERFKNNPNIIDIPHTLGVATLGNSSVDIKINGTTTPEDHYQITRDILQAVKEICDENNFEIPYPQVVVHNGDK